MNPVNSTLSAPVLRQSVKFGERYVSSALNRKFAGILPTGIYRGYEVRPGGVAKVLVCNGEDYDRSIAVVERDGYNMTVTMDDAGYVDIPAAGTWHIVIEAFYVETQTGYQRIVAREQLEKHHICLATVIVSDISIDIAENMIDMSNRHIAETNKISAWIDTARLNDIAQAKQLIRLSDRVTRHELAVAGTLDAMRANDIELARQIIRLANSRTKHELAVACTGQVTVVEVGNCGCEHTEGGDPLNIDPTDTFIHALYGDTEPGKVSG